MIQDLGYWYGYCIDIFNKLNGWINPTYRATLRFGVSTPKNPTWMGRSALNVVMINLLSNFDWLFRIKRDSDVITDDIARSTLIFTIMHELSHCEQDTMFLPESIPKCVDQEYANDTNVKYFYERNKDKLEKYLGSYDQIFLEVIIETYTKHFVKSSKYYRIHTPYDKVIRLLEYLVDDILFPKKFNEGQYKNISITYTDANRNRYNQLVYYNHQWINPIPVDFLLACTLNNEDDSGIFTGHMCNDGNLNIEVEDPVSYYKRMTPIEMIR